MSEQPKFHTRHEVASKLGRRVSRGEWERMNRAYEVYHAKDFEGKRSFRLFGKDIRPCVTHVLMPETTKANRKVSLGDRFNEDSKRARYNLDKPVGVIR